MTYLPTTQELVELTTHDADECVTIYSPLLSQTGDSNPNRIRLKNALKQAKILLEGTGLSTRDVRKIVAPIYKYLDSREFLSSSRTSLAVFASSSLFRVYNLPTSTTPDIVTVGKGFNLEPLNQVLEDTKEYYLLSLNHNDVQLFKGGHYGIEAVTPNNFPSNLIETLGIDELPNVAETHTVGPASRAQHSEAFHGHYNDKQVNKKFLKEFFRHIDRYLKDHLRGESHPLIIGGVDYLLSIYRQVNTYPHLLEESITGNLERTALEDLLSRSWGIVARQHPQEA